MSVRVVVVRVRPRCRPCPRHTTRPRRPALSAPPCPPRRVVIRRAGGAHPDDCGDRQGRAQADGAGHQGLARPAVPDAGRHGRVRTGTTSARALCALCARAPCSCCARCARHVVHGSWGQGGRGALVGGVEAGSLCACAGPTHLFNIHPRILLPPSPPPTAAAAARSRHAPLPTSDPDYPEDSSRHALLAAAGGGEVSHRRSGSSGGLPEQAGSSSSKH